MDERRLEKEETLLLACKLTEEELMQHARALAREIQQLAEEKQEFIELQKGTKAVIAEHDKNIGLHTHTCPVGSSMISKAGGNSGAARILISFADPHPSRRRNARLNSG